jgi:hypothetical protein
MTCLDQVQVAYFYALTTRSLAWGLNPADPNQLTLDTAFGSTPGIAFTAKVTITAGAIPLDHLHLRYIQNKTVYTGTVFYDPPPNFVAVLRDGTTLPPHRPLLDSRDNRRPPAPFYDAQFQEHNPAGADRDITATDSPSLTINVIRRSTHGRFQRVDLTETFQMFLVCMDDRRMPRFNALQMLEWTVRYRGTFDAASQTFMPDATAGIVAQASVPATRPPVDHPPLANAVSTFRNSSP